MSSETVSSFAGLEPLRDDRDDIVARTGLAGRRADARLDDLEVGRAGGDRGSGEGDWYIAIGRFIGEKVARSQTPKQALPLNGSS